MEQKMCFNMQTNIPNNSWGYVVLSNRQMFSGLLIIISYIHLNVSCYFWATTGTKQMEIAIGNLTEDCVWLVQSLFLQFCLVLQAAQKSHTSVLHELQENKYLHCIYSKANCKMHFHSLQAINKYWVAWT